MKNKKQLSFEDKKPIRIEEITSSIDLKDIIIIRIDKFVLTTSLPPSLPDNFEEYLINLKYKKVDDEGNVKLCFDFDKYELVLCKATKEVELIVSPFYVFLSKKDILEHVVGNEFVMQINSAINHFRKCFLSNIILGNMKMFDNIRVQMTVPYDIIMNDSLDKVSLDYSKPIKSFNAIFNHTFKEFIYHMNNMREGFKYYNNQEVGGN